MSLKIGTRGSLLALAQTGFVAKSIQKEFPKLEVQVQIIKTTGDKIMDAPLSRIGSKGLFTKELEDALSCRAIDLAVHSLKDLPSDLPEGLTIGAILKRADSRDCLVSVQRWNLKTLPRGAKVGTSSLRRQAQLLALRPDLKVENLRGNLDTRVRKLREGLADAIVIASAGITRLGDPALLKGLHLFKIPCAQMLPAAGQGALAIEIRKNDRRVLSAIRFLNHGATENQMLCERAFLKTLKGGCQIPIGIYSRMKGSRIFLDGIISSVTGGQSVRSKLSGPVKNSEKLGKILAERLLQSGGRAILEAIRY